MQDADQLFTNLLLSRITPDTINKIYEQEWEDSLWQLSYEQRQAMAEYRDAAQKLALAGYDLDGLDSAISNVSQRLEAIDAARKKERDLAAEYRTLLQVHRYVKLADEPKFVKGLDWEELHKKNQKNAKALTETEHTTELPKKNLHPDKATVHKETQKWKASIPGIDI